MESFAQDDAPPKRLPQLQVITSPTQQSLNSPSDSAFRLSDGLLSPRSPAPIEHTPQSPLVRALQSGQKSTEFQKILTLSLNNLRNRRRPPSAFDEFRASVNHRGPSKVGEVFQTIRGAVRLGKKTGLVDVARTYNRDEDSDDDEENSGAFSTDATVEHLAQLRDILMMSKAFGWNIQSRYA